MIPKLSCTFHPTSPRRTFSDMLTLPLRAISMNLRSLAVLVLKYKHDHIAIIYYVSGECQRVTPLVVGAEVHALHSFRYRFSWRWILNTSAKLSTLIITGSKRQLGITKKLSTASEKRLLIEISPIREAYSNIYLISVRYVGSKCNSAHTFTKQRRTRMCSASSLKLGNSVIPLINGSCRSHLSNW